MSTVFIAQVTGPSYSGIVKFPTFAEAVEWVQNGVDAFRVADFMATILPAQVTEFSALAERMTYSR